MSACAVERDSGGKFVLFVHVLSTLCRHIGLLFGERLGTLFTSSDSKISGFTRPYRIRCGFIFFPLWRADLFFSGFAVEFAGCVWTVAVSGKKMLRIRKYPDTCGRGLSCGIFNHVLCLDQSLDHERTDLVDYNWSYTLLAKPMKTLVMRYLMI